MLTDLRVLGTSRLFSVLASPFLIQDLSSNEIKQTKEGDFSMLSLLQELRLNNNKIVSISQKTFVGLD